MIVAQVKWMGSIFEDFIEWSLAWLDLVFTKLKEISRCAVEVRSTAASMQEIKTIITAKTTKEKK